MRSLSTKELVELSKDEGVQVLDVREEEEVAQGKISGALNLPVSQFVERVDELDKDTEYYVICRTNRRSSAIAEELNRRGYKVSVVSDGMQGWTGETE